MRKCNICGGTEFSLGPNERRAINGSLPQCLGCGSLERHRIARKAWDLVPLKMTFDKKLLQFSNDPSIDASRFSRFELSIFNSDNSLDLMNLNRSNGSYDIIVLNHVLEHVPDDREAFQEIHRIMKDIGFCQFTVPDPVNNPFTDDWGFPDQGNHGHYRIYGSDLISRLCVGTDIDVIFIRITDEVTENEDIVYFSSRCRQTLIDLKECLVRSSSAEVGTSWIEQGANPAGKEIRHIRTKSQPETQEKSGRTAFSIIMPTFNRRSCISTAIKSVLAQDFDAYEIIVVDDGSSDGTCEYLESLYRQEIIETRVVLVRQEHLGVSAARNNGLKAARYDWICYLDTDNQMKSRYLSTYNKYIREFQQYKCFYSKVIHKRSQYPVGRQFDFSELVSGNYIDMNVFVHFNMYPDPYFLFNTALTRVVDYDFILKFCALHEPFFIDAILVSYDDSESRTRISNSECIQTNLSIIYDSEIKIKTRHLLNEFRFLKDMIQERDAQLAERDSQLAERDSQLAERDAELAGLINSRSWKITKPLRWLKGKLRVLPSR